MSWFDATGLANIAKSALKGAQKTIDKALDIRDDDEDDIGFSENDNSQKKTSQKRSESDFFAAWGLNEKKNVEQDIKKSRSNKPVSSDIWGSFSGSFFQIDGSQTDNKKPILVSTQPQKFKLTLDNEEGQAPLASPENELTPTEGIICDKANNVSNFEKNDVESLGRRNNVKIENCELFLKAGESNQNLKFLESDETQNMVKKNEEMTNTLVDEKVTTRQKGRRNSNRNSFISNRLSIISTDSEGKKSCDSVEVIGSPSCATSPDTDLPSISTSSSMGLPVSSSCTESVEVINTLGSPSSIEVIDSHYSGRSTLSPDVNSIAEDISSIQYSKELIMISSPKNSLTDVSPESVEVLPDLNELDEELSVADSYTSASESTGATILEPSFQYYRKAGSFTDVSTASMKLRSGDSTPDVSTKLPQANKSSSDLLSESIQEKYSFDILNNGQVKSDDYRRIHRDQYGFQTNNDNNSECQMSKSSSVQGSPTKKVMSSYEEKASILRCEEQKGQKFDVGVEILKTSVKRDGDDEGLLLPTSDKSDSLSLDEVCGSCSSYSDSKTLINDSSREGTLMESSAEDAAKLTDEIQDEGAENLNRGDPKIQQVRNSNNSFYVKNLLAEAMGEDSVTRETSPTLSEKSRSDLVKVGSEQTSEHTSGDELETTTSSDIEIISRYSPNGDSSSTASRHSPAKLLHNNPKGKLSLVAVDILGKVTQPKVKGHQREPSEASSFCSEDNSAEVERLTKKVAELSEILADRESKIMDLSKVNVEMRERSQELRQKFEQAKLEVENRFSSGITDAEKDELIKQLREEGDKLSKKELKQANLIKTLRAQEKVQQSTLEKNKTEIQSLVQEVEKLRSKLGLKEDLEKSQAENILQLTNKIGRQDKEIANLLDEVEKSVVKSEQFKICLEKTELELERYRGKFGDLESELRQARSIAEAKEKKLDFLDSNQLKIEMELECLKQQLKKNEELLSERETCNREEKNNLMRRLQEAERRNEELTQSVSHATKPLLRQMEALQATIAHERETWENQERNLIQKLDETEMNLSSAQYHEKVYKQEVVELRLKVTNLESQLQGTHKDTSNIKEQIKSLEIQMQAAKQAHENERKIWEEEKQKLLSETNGLRNEMLTIERQLTMERTNAELDQRKISALQEQLKEVQQGPRGDSNSPRSSPTLSFGRASLSESLSGNWPQFPDDSLETFSTSARCSNVYDNLRMGNATSLIEGLQAQLKMRDGEVGQLQWELHRRDTERAALTNELSALTTKVEELENSLRQMESVDNKLKELQTNYDALLEMYGEKVEEADELRLDLADVKDMYKTQIDQLLKRENQSLPL